MSSKALCILFLPLVAIAGCDLPGEESHLSFARAVSAAEYTDRFGGDRPDDEDWLPIFEAAKEEKENSQDDRASEKDGTERRQCENPYCDCEPVCECVNCDCAGADKDAAVEPKKTQPSTVTGGSLPMYTIIGQRYYSQPVLWADDNVALRPQFATNPIRRQWYEPLGSWMWLCKDGRYRLPYGWNTGAHVAPPPPQ